MSCFFTPNVARPPFRYRTIKSPLGVPREPTKRSDGNRFVGEQSASLLVITLPRIPGVIRIMPSSFCIPLLCQMIVSPV